MAGAVVCHAPCPSYSKLHPPGSGRTACSNPTQPIPTQQQVNGDFGAIFSTLLPGTTAKLEPPEGGSFMEASWCGKVVGRRTQSGPGGMLGVWAIVAVDPMWTVPCSAAWPVLGLTNPQPGPLPHYCPRHHHPLQGLEVKVAFGGVWKESLSELSGGQKSLLALSLILAMLLFKPAPIYILDEVRMEGACRGGFCGWKVVVCREREWRKHAAMVGH